MELPGFNISSSSFSSVVVTRRLYDALFPEDRKTLRMSELREQLVTRLEALFRVCLENGDTYIVIHADDSFWGVINNNWEAAGVLENLEVKELAEFYVRGRKDIHYDGIDTALTELVDRWTQVVDLVASLPVPRRFSLVQRSTPESLGALVQSVRSLSLTDTAAAATETSAPVWPPAHFTTSEIAVISDPRLRQDVWGLSTDHWGAAPPYPTMTAMPLAIRRFLCWTALTQNGPQSPWRLSLSPVAFESKAQKFEWKWLIGNRSMLCTSTGEVLHEVTQSLREGKHLHMALFIKWFARPHQVKDAADANNMPAEIFWAKQVKRHGLVLVVRKLADAEKAVQIHLMDARLLDQNCEPTAGKYEIFGVRQFLVDKLKRWAKESGWTIGRAMIGGRPAGKDGVEKAAMFLHQVLVSEAALDDERNWQEWNGFVEETDVDMDMAQQ